MSWTTLTEREKELDRAIDNCGITLRDTRLCLHRVMRRIGARSNEADFVRERIELRLRTQQLLDRTDDFINRTNRMLDAF
ncbi:MAG: hypothetical protein IJ760_01275 [Bacteroidales bacterium]|nr:hypothetical protein [Bacteroidales bacterium]